MPCFKDRRVKRLYRNTLNRYLILVLSSLCLLCSSRVSLVDIEPCPACTIDSIVSCHCWAVDGLHLRVELSFLDRYNIVLLRVVQYQGGQPVSSCSIPVGDSQTHREEKGSVDCWVAGTILVLRWYCTDPLVLGVAFHWPGRVL